MKLHGIATALYDDAEGRTVVTATTLASESADKIFIEKVNKTEINPSKTGEVRNALNMVMDEICRQPAQRGIIQGGIHRGREAVIPVEVVYGTPFEHPAKVYRTMLLDAFPQYFPKRKKVRNSPVAELLKKLFHARHETYGQKGSRIESNSYLFYHDGKELIDHRIIECDKLVGVEFDRLHEAAKAGDTEARRTLEYYARQIARSVKEELHEGTYSTTRFIVCGEKHSLKYKFLDWFDLKDVFVNEFVRGMGNPHNVCVKTSNDRPSPPFADICATYIADQFDILEGVSRKRHIYARPLDLAA